MTKKNAKKSAAKKPAKSSTHLKAIAAADQENAKKRDHRAASADGMTASERAMAKGAKAKAGKPAKENKAMRTSALDAAATVLAKAGKPMASKAMIEAMASAGLWTSPGGKTPEATLYAAIIREIAKKGPQARFKKTDRGMFASTGKGA
ncbi:MAG: winged helix-turn-helix domain-containing protein [Phycisphaerales bacterium]